MLQSGKYRVERGGRGERRTVTAEEQVMKPENECNKDVGVAGVQIKKRYVNHIIFQSTARPAPRISTLFLMLFTFASPIMDSPHSRTKFT